MVQGAEGKLVCVGKISTPHGVRGDVNIMPYVEDSTFFLAHSSYYNEKGEAVYTVRIKGQKKQVLIAAVEGVTDRNAAERLRGTALYMPRDLLPEADEEEFYYEDLVGLAVHTAEQKDYGTVKAVYNFGAGDVIEIVLASSGKLELFSFTKEVVPEVRVAEGYVLLKAPEMIRAKEEPSSERASEEE